MSVAYALSFAASFLQAVFTPALVLYAHSLGLGKLEVGVLTGLSSLVYVAGALYSSRLYAAAGEARLIAASFALMAAGFAAHTLSKGFWQLALSAGAVFLGFGLFWPAVEANLSYSGASASMFSFSWSSGSLVGALVTSTLLKLDFASLFLLYAAVSAAQALAALRLPSAARPGGPGSADVKGLLGLWTPWVYCLAYSASSGGILAFYPLFVEANGLSKDYISIVNFSMLLARTATFFLYDRLPDPMKSSLAASLAFLASAALPFTLNAYAAAALAAAAGYAQGVIYAAAITMVFRRPERVEDATSLFESFIGLGYALAPPLGGSASSALGVDPMVFTSFLSILLAAAGRAPQRGRLHSLG